MYLNLLSSDYSSGNPTHFGYLKVECFLSQWGSMAVVPHSFTLLLASAWLHQLLVANLGTLRDTVFSFWCNFQACYVVNIKKTRLKFYCDCWCPRSKKAFWKNYSPWTVTSEVNIWLGNHFVLSLRWGFNHFRCRKYLFLIGHHQPLSPSPSSSYNHGQK